MKRLYHAGLSQSGLLLLGLFFCFCSTVFAVETPQPVCIPRVPASVTMMIDSSATGDWDSFTPLTIGYADDPAGNLNTRIAADSNYLYFIAEVTTNFDQPQVQTFFIGIDGASGTKMLQIQPFEAGDESPLPMTANDSLTQLITQFAVGSWTVWTDPTPSNTDFSRAILNTIPNPTWILEGRINLAHIGISGVTTVDNLDLFLFIDASDSSTTIQRYWPDQGGGFVDLPEPASLSFGQNRCPDIAFSEPFVNYGKTLLQNAHDRSVVISNNGEAGSQLLIQIDSGLDVGGSSDFSLESLTRDSDSLSPPFMLGLGETSTAVLRYTPTSGTSIASPHKTELQVVSNDPDEPLATLNIQGNGRQYIDTVLILDQSGSMIDQDKWITTEWASEIAAELIRLYSFNSDRFGIVSFGGTSGNPESFELRPLTTFPSTPSSFMSALTDADLTFYTPIGLGIEEAHDQFSSDTRSHVALLMSDGKHNRPTSTSGATTVGELDLPPAVHNNDLSMRIHTVALGTDSGVSTALLNDIRSHYNPLGASLTPATTFNISDDPEQLAEFFVEPLMEQMIVNRIDFDVDPVINGYPVERGAHSVLAMVGWAQGSIPQDIIVEVYNEDGTGAPIITYESGDTGYYKGPDSSQPYTYIYIDNVEDLAHNRVWRIKDTGDNPIAPPVGFPFVLIDLNIKAVFSVDQQVNGTGNDIIVTAILSEVGRPINHTMEHPVNVEVLIGKPDEGFGTYVSTHDLDSCEAVSPTLPPVDPIGFDPDVGLGTTTSSVNMATATGTSSSSTDIPAPPFQKIAALFQGCNKNNLLRTRLPGEKLYDDGSHGDETADDGIYTLRFTNTEYEGSYTFQFHVKGETPTGAKFTRVRNLSAHLTVDVDPGTTQFDSRVLSQIGNTIKIEYYVTPRDKFGGYMGPGYPNLVKFTSSGGTWQGPVRDYNNGIYSRVLQYDDRQGDPEVTVEVQGKPIKYAVTPFEIVPFIGYTFFDSSLNLDDGIAVGIRFAYRYTNRLTFELEGGTTFTETSTGDSGHVIQALLNARYNIYSFNTRLGQLTPYATAGAGWVFFRGLGNDDEAFALQGGVGATLDITNSLGIRVDSRILRFNDVWNAGTTTNFQVTGGVAFRF